eukprot:COSAG06_NODE_48931_length_328_cov_4.082969_1_plen_83_part_01
MKRTLPPPAPDKTISWQPLLLLLPPIKLSADSRRSVRVRVCERAGPLVSFQTTGLVGDATVLFKQNDVGKDLQVCLPRGTYSA